MDLKKLAEPFPAENIRWRVGRCGLKDGKPWAKILAYVDARDIMNRLDEVCGPEGWGVDYEPIDGGFLCKLAICCDDVWITKADGAPLTDFEPLKGGISDALKRAGAVWSIGRYLYRLSEGWADCSSDQYALSHKNAQGKDKQNKAFYFSWNVSRKTIDELKAAGSKQAEPQKDDAASSKSKQGPRVTAAQKKMIGMLRREMGLSDEVYREELFRSYHCRSTTELTRDQAGELISRLEAKRKANIERDVQDTFGDGGKVATLQAMAKGHIEKIKVLGEKYQNGDPIVYKNESIPVESLVELEEVVAAMGDEGELERLIIRMEALLSTISF